MSKITEIRGREILDSRGNPTLEVEVGLEDGTRAVAGVPSGASTGKFEAIELRDGDSERFSGKGVLRAVANVNGELKESLLGMDAADQRALDQKMIAQDGTENKARLGANAILGISLSVARAESMSRKKPLYEHIRSLMELSEPISRFPMPMFNVINGGKHSDSGLSAQEFKLIPFGIDGYPEQLRAGSEIFHSLKGILEKARLSVGVGDEGGFAPRLESHARTLEVLHEAISAAGYAPGKDVFIGFDVAANSFYDGSEDRYRLEPEGVQLSRESIINVYRDWVAKYAVVSIEDGLHEEDWSGWAQMKEKLEREPVAWGRKIMLIGDDLLVTNTARVRKALEERSCNSVLIKPNQIGTLSETLDCIGLAHGNGLDTVISHRSGETVDDFIADLAVGSDSQFIKTGSLSRGERLAKYNRLWDIWNKTR